MKYNLLRISQLCDKGYRVRFEANACHVINSNTNKIIYIGKMHENLYVIYIDEVVLNNESCLIANDVNDSWLWHRRLGHVIPEYWGKKQSRSISHNSPLSQHNSSCVTRNNKFDLYKIKLNQKLKPLLMVLKHLN